MRYWKNNFFKLSIMFLILFTAITYANAENLDGEDYWDKLLKKADKIYGGWDLNVSLNVDAEGKTGVTFSAPIYSKKDKVDIVTQKANYLKQGAEYIEILEVNKRVIVMLKEKAATLKSIMGAEGLSAVNEYYAVAELIIKKQVEMDKAKRELEAMLK